MENKSPRSKAGLVVCLLTDEYIVLFWKGLVAESHHEDWIENTNSTECPVGKSCKYET